MVRPLPIHIGESTTFSIPIAIGLFVSVSFLVGMCAKHARHVSKKHESKSSEPNTPKSPLPSPKQLIATISHKAMMPLGHGKKSGAESIQEKEEGGLWQKAILMGDKCRPPEFSGVIYYDYSGNRVAEMPKSPRATPMSPLRNFTFPMQKNDGNLMY